ncbi:MAG TPA: GNAT family N-acetyltransferase [Polyangiaceae bacterium]|nr:GNAT family N-acetyltransferase [Polyangiaceae bacterium]
MLTPIAPDQASVLTNLFQLYVHDFSELLPIDLEQSGLFQVPSWDQWWTRDDHFPYFIRSADQVRLLGFALVRRGSRVTGATAVMDVAEFFVARGARGRGVGRAAAHELFAHFREPWEIRVRDSNALAQKFWSGVVMSWLGRAVAPEPFEQGGIKWNVLRVPASSARS